MDPIQETDTAKTIWHWVLVIAVNVAVLVELCVAMYLAASSPDDFTATFMKAFFSMLIPTLAISILGKRRLRSVAVPLGD
jgi:Ni,Fe-hydrogenase I cytochrome b subunit